MANPEMMAPEAYPDVEEEGRIVENANIQALAQLNSAEINQQIMTARAYPRSVTGFRRYMREMVTYDQATALSCLYALKRGKKLIEGPSIRFAEAALQSWGNARAGSRIVDIGDEFITAQGFFYDLEKNMAVAFEVLRRITDSHGNRYGEDMIMVTGNAAGSIALRNAITKGIPRTAWNESYQEARMCSIGKGESISVKRENMIKAFAPLNVDKNQIFGLLGVKGLDDVSVDHMIQMFGILNSIKEGEITSEKAFAPENMHNPDEVRPNQPRRSDFARDKTPAADQPKPDAGAEPAAKPAAAEPKPAEQKPAATATAEPAAENNQAQAKLNLPVVDAKTDLATRKEEDRLDMIKEAYVELKGETGIKVVSDLCQSVIDVGLLTAEEQVAWESACNDHSKALYDQARAKRKR